MKPFIIQQCKLTHTIGLSICIFFCFNWLLFCTTPLTKTPSQVVYKTHIQPYKSYMAYVVSIETLGTKLEDQGSLNLTWNEESYLREETFFHQLELTEVETTFENEFARNLIQQIINTPFTYQSSRSGTALQFPATMQAYSSFIEPIIHVLKPVFPKETLAKDDSYSTEWNGSFTLQELDYELSISISHNVINVYEKEEEIFLEFYDQVHATLTAENIKLGKGRGNRHFLFNYTKGYIVENHLDFRIDELIHRNQVGFFGIRSVITGEIILEMRAK